MSSIEEFRAQFENLNFKVTTAVLQKCVELCAIYGLDSEDFVDEWLAFSASKLNGAAPTIDALDRMERNELKKQSRSAADTPKAHQANIEVSSVRKTPVRQNLLNEMNAGTPVPMQIEESDRVDVPSENWHKRSGAGVVLETYGTCDADAFKQRRKEVLSVKIKNKDIENAKYMCEKFLSKKEALNEMYRCIISDIVTYHKLEPTQENLKQYSGEMVICGRIFSDTTARLEPGSIQFEGLSDLYRGQRIKLNINKLDKVALFSGQAAVVVGNNMKNWFRADEIYTGSPIAPLESSLGISENLQIIVAAGPFTLQNNLLYEPLETFLKYVIDFKPNLLILMGPFLEDTHPQIDNMNELYDNFFENIIDGIMKRLSGSSSVQVILVPSHKDIHNHCIFPSPPYKLKTRHDGLYLAPNPFILDVEGLRIGGSSSDVLFHLGKVEFSRGAPGERISNLISHVFNQRSFYPLYPPDTEIRVDYQLIERFGMIENQLHVMLLPSNFKHFVKNVENCIVINPERLTKGNSAGTFARLQIKPFSSSESITEKVSCHIYRV